jgi:dipeptide/tripeptide permease
MTDAAAWIPLALIALVVARCLYDMAKQWGRFSGTFWAAIITELLHCLASYCMLAYLIVYLAQDLGFGDLRANFLLGLMWFMGYFLPILIGALADRYGFRQTMLVSLVIITAGYFLASRVTAYPSMFAALMLIALGGAVMKPVIAGTVKAASREEDRTLGFSIYYMVINVGSFIGPFLANGVRTATGNPALILVACGVVEAAALAVTAVMFRNVTREENARGKPLLTVLNEMVVVLVNLRLFVTGLGFAACYLAFKREWLTAGQGAAAAGAWLAANLLLDAPLRARERRLGPQPQFLQPQRFGDGKFLAFILIFSGVWALYSQIWTNIPLFITTLDPAMKAHIEYFQAVDPIMIVFFQVLIGKWMGRYRPLPSMVVGICIASVAVGTVGFFGGHLGAWAVGISLVIWSVGEMMFSLRMVEYVSVIAPKDKLALYIGYGFLPFALGFGLGPSVGAHLVRFFERAGHPDWVWYGFGLWSLVVAGALWVYDRVANAEERRSPKGGPGVANREKREGEPHAS